MPKPAQLTKAQLVEMAANLKDTAPGATPINVQFNPETLKVTYSNQLVASDNQTAQTGSAAMQHVGKGTTKLAVQLLFDVTHPTASEANAKDVCDLTKQVIYFITPNNKLDPGKYVIPGVRFQWGTFSFTGVMESLEESLELFSNDGKPLRASLSIGLTQQEIVAFEPGQGVTLPATAATSSSKPAGTVPLTSATSGATLQSLADTSGSGNDWQDIAAANGIENPRLLDAGQLIDVNATLSVSI